MTLRAVILLAVLVAIGSGIALVAGVGDRVALALLCWSAASIPISLAVGRFLHEHH